MNRTVWPGPRSGQVRIPASKSRAHRLLICAALAGRQTTLICQGISRDIQATADCLREMGSEIRMEGECISVFPLRPKKEETVLLPCGESGSTLRFLLPVAGSLGLKGCFRMEGRLPERPLHPLWEVLEAHGMRLRQEKELLYFEGQLSAGEYAIPGNISSQYISGLLFALLLLRGESKLTVTGPLESADYVRMTEDALTLFGFSFEKKGYQYRIPGCGTARKAGESPWVLPVEADWSSAAFLLAMGALSPEGICVEGLDMHSSQGDRQILTLLEGFGAKVERIERGILVRKGALRGMEIDAAGIPDLVPVLAAVAALAEGETTIRHAERLRLKESDRLQTTSAMLSALGAEIRETEDGLWIRGKPFLRGGKVSSFRDHRIAMAASVAAGLCREPVIIEEAECTEKSFPKYWELLQELKTDSGIFDLN